MENHNLSSFINQKYFENGVITEPENSVNVSLIRNYSSINNRNSNSKRRQILTTSKLTTSNKKTFQQYGRTGTTRNKELLNTQCSRRTITNTLETQRGKVVCAIYENGSGFATKIGLCVINFNHGTMIFSEFIDTQIYIRIVHKLQIYEPTDIIVPIASISPVPSKLMTIIKYNIPESTKVSGVSPKYFDSKEGLQYLLKFSIDSKEIKIKSSKFIDKTFGLCAVSGVLEYIDKNMSKVDGVQNYSSFRINFENPADTMLIDSHTIKGLELIENNIEKGKLSLLKFLDSTSTSMGKRLLRNNILQPLTDQESIAMRLNAVKELIDNSDLVQAITSELKRYQDLDSLFSKLLSVDHMTIRAEQKINYVLLLKDTVQTTKFINNLLKGRKLQSGLLKEIQNILEHSEIEEVGRLINEVINENCFWASTNIDIQNQRIYAVKSGTNGLLVASRKIYKCILDQIFEEITKLSEELDIPLDHNFDPIRGFSIKISRTIWPDVSTLPKIFINKVKKGKCIECNSLNLIKLNSRLKEIISEISLLSEKCVHTLLNDVTRYISTLFMISEGVSILDLICSFATTSLKYNYCIPDISNNFIVQESKHPVLDVIIPNFVPNDISSIKNTSSLQIITGCNMSGKSVYLKQIAILCIMFQIGSPVPARKASMPIFRNLHARLCNDSIEMCSSNFTFEMKEIAYFLNDLCNETLLLLDELGRNSSIGDGFSISLAVTEYILQTNCTSFVSTHFQDIPKILINKPSVAHFHMRSELSENKVNMFYTLQAPSSSLISNSGLKVVSNMFDATILEDAYKICSKLLSSRKIKEKSDSPDRDEEPNPQLINQIKTIHNFSSILKQLINEDNISLVELKSLQNQFISSFNG